MYWRLTVHVPPVMGGIGSKSETAPDAPHTKYSPLLYYEADAIDTAT